MKKYSAALVAMKTEKVGSFLNINVMVRVGAAVAFITTNDIEEAKKRAVVLAHEAFSTEDGWSDQSATVAEIPLDWMADDK